MPNKSLRDLELGDEVAGPTGVLYRVITRHPTPAGREGHCSFDVQDDSGVLLGLEGSPDTPVAVWSSRA